MICLLGIAGCSEVKKLELSQAKLQGTVTYKGKPVPHALIVVSVGAAGAGGGMAGQGFADKSGKYLIDNVPAGPVKIGVNTDAGKGNMMGAAMAAAQGGDKSAAPTFVDLPKKFFDPNTSGIATNIDDPKGVNNFDIKID